MVVEVAGESERPSRSEVAVNVDEQRLLRRVRPVPGTSSTGTTASSSLTATPNGSLSN